MKKILFAVLLLSGLLTAPAYAWPEVDSMNMCNRAVQVTRAYQGGAKGWVDRDSHAATQKAQAFARNCPQIKAPVKVYKKKAIKKVVRKKVIRRSKTCKRCYRKGFRDGYRAALRGKRIYKKKRRIGGYRTHAEEVADCKRVDWANNASRTKVVAAW